MCKSQKQLSAVRPLILCHLYKWYEWVFFPDTSVTYPHNAMVLGRDLRPAIDNGPAMACKILKANGKVLYRSIIRPLNPDEIADETMTKEREKLNNSVESLLCELFKYEDFSNDSELEVLETPSFEPHGEDEKETHSKFPHNHDNNADPDTYDACVGAGVKLPIGDTMMSA